LDNPGRILAILDRCCEAFIFPMLDNGYVYLGATRLSAYRSPTDWALVIEVFGFSPRSGSPDVHVYTYSSRLHNRNTARQYVDEQAYEQYLRKNVNNESRFFSPFERDVWQDEENLELVGEGAEFVVLRNLKVPLPNIGVYEANGFELQEAPRVAVFELCRLLAISHRNLVLASVEERRSSVLPEMVEILKLDDWCHPDLLSGELPGTNECFQQIALVLSTGDNSLYQPTQTPNTHWSNWPDGGRL